MVTGEASGLTKGKKARGGFTFSDLEKISGYNFREYKLMN